MNNYEILVRINGHTMLVRLQAQNYLYAKLQAETLYWKNSLIRLPIQVR
jgi:hypothetical protein